MVLKVGEWGEIHDLASKNASGMYTVRVKQRVNGGYRTLTASGKTRAEARRRLLEKMGLRLNEQSGVRTMDDLWSAYAQAAALRGRPKPKTVLVHRDIYLRHIKPVMGRRHPAEIKRAEIHSFLAAVKGTSPQRPYTTLRVMYRQALMMGIVENDPTVNAFHFTSKRRNSRTLVPRSLG